MIKNYFKVAIGVLKRNKLYTFISLFGISFTLMVLMVSVAFFNNELGSNKPLSNKNKILVVPQINVTMWDREVNTVIDSSLVDGNMTYDTTRIETPIVGSHRSSSSSGLGLKFVEQYILPMKSPEAISMTTGGVIEVYPTDQRLAYSVLFTDANYWKIFDFVFLEGGPYNDAQVEGQARDIIMTDKAAREYFGIQDSYMNRSFIWGRDNYTVVGVVERVNTSLDLVQSDLFIPYTNASAQSLDYEWGHLGGLNIAFLGQEKLISDELRGIEKTAELPNDFDQLKLFEKNVTDIYAWGLMGDQNERSGKKFMFVVFMAIGLFLLIPTLNLINLNITRILERSDEIGVRKAFGARTIDLVFQFLFENLIITILGGIIGLVMTMLLMNWINKIQMFEGSYLEWNPKIFFMSLMIVLVFALTSGILPAWKMARSNISEALKQNKL